MPSENKCGTHKIAANAAIKNQADEIFLTTCSVFKPHLKNVAHVQL